MGTPIKISVITPTNRPDGLELVSAGLKRQTHRNFEWIVTAPKGYDYKDVVPDTALVDPPKSSGDYWPLYKAYNRAIKRAEGEYILSVQDFTFFDSDLIRKLLFNMREDRIITGVGHKYTEVYPELGPAVWKDPRYDGTGAFRECPHNWIEFNLCCFPKGAIEAVGGFDEELDKYSGICGLDVVDRLEIIGGYEFYIDQSMKSYSIDHGRAPQWEERNAIHGPYFERRRLYESDPVLNYL